MTFYVQTYPYRRTARRWAVPAENRERILGVNIREEDDVYVLSALVPGLRSEELNIQILENVVLIEGEYTGNSPEDTADERSYLVRELPTGRFTRTLRLPAPIDPEHVEADINNGVLTLRLPRAESARPKQIKIKAG